MRARRSSLVSRLRGRRPLRPEGGAPGGRLRCGSAPSGVSFSKPDITVLGMCSLPHILTEQQIVKPVKAIRISRALERMPGRFALILQSIPRVSDASTSTPSPESIFFLQVVLLSMLRPASYRCGNLLVLSLLATDSPISAVILVPGMQSFAPVHRSNPGFRVFSLQSLIWVERSKLAD